MTADPQDRPCTGYGPCGPCGATPARLYPAGWRCADAHPRRAGRAARARRGPVLPARPCWCGHCPDPAARSRPGEGPSGAHPRGCRARVHGRGWPVFVLGRSKRPVANCPACRAAGPGHDPAGCGCLTCHGFHAATLDPARLAAMLAAVPRGLLAIRTGTAAGLAVVDIDPRNGGQLDRALMTPTAAVATGGGGWHLYYRHPGGPLLAALPGRAGVDVKADGGYVVAPPSVHPGTGRAYRWAGERPVAEMPPALAAALAPPPAAGRPAPLSGPRRPAGRGASHHPRRCSPRSCGPWRTPRKAAAGSPCTARPAAPPAWSPPGPSPSRRPRRAHRGRAGRRADRT